MLWSPLLAVLSNSGHAAFGADERVRHVNRIKGLLFSQGLSGYQPLRRDRRTRLEELRTGDGRPLPAHLKMQISRELDRLELLIGQSKAVEAERDAMLAVAPVGCAHFADCEQRAAGTGDAARLERHRAEVCRCLVVGGASRVLLTTDDRLLPMRMTNSRHIPRISRNYV